MNGWQHYDFRTFAPTLDESETDVYETFRRMLARGEVPDGIDHLLRESCKSG